MCEELGFIGAVIIIVLFALLVWRGFMIGMKAPDKFGSMLAIGLTAQVGIQVVFNMAVVTNTIPNTGISLPFFSYRGHLPRHAARPDGYRAVDLAANEEKRRERVVPAGADTRRPDNP